MRQNRRFAVFAQLPIAASQAGATGGAAWHELVMKLTHIVAGLGLVRKIFFLSVILLLALLLLPDDPQAL